MSQNIYLKSFKRLKILIYSSAIIMTPFIFHQIILKLNPDLSRKLYLNKFLYDEINYQKLIKDKDLANLLIIYRTLLDYNQIPPAEIQPIETIFLNKKMKHPIGLGCGIDNLGLSINNLNQLGFEFIQTGPLVDTNDYDDVNSEGKKIFINDNAIYHSSKLNWYSVDYSLMNIQRLLNKNNFEIGIDLKISNHSSSMAPYLADSLFITMLNSGLNFADHITFNLSSYANKLSNQYKNKKKFEIFLNKIKTNIYKEVGLKAALEFENVTNPDSTYLLSKYYNFPANIIYRSRSKIFIRLDTILSEEEIKMQIEKIKESGIIDGIIVGGMSKERNYFMSGDKIKENSLLLLQLAYKYTKGEIPLISTGGILTGDDVYERIKNGADFVFIYSAFLLRGPYCCEKILKELNTRMNKENKKNIAEIRVL